MRRNSLADFEDYYFSRSLWSKQRFTTWHARNMRPTLWVAH